jgi:sugar phosphate isomerase/epimerase
MLLGAVTYNVLKDWSLDTILTKLPELGFEAVELRTTHAHRVELALPPAERQAIQQRFQRSKVRLLSFGTTCEFHSTDPAVVERNIAEARQWVDLAHDTGAWAVKVRPNGLPKDVPAEKTLAQIGQSLRQLGEYGAGKGVEIWLEVHGSQTQLPPNAAAIMRAAKHEQVGLCWNSNPTDVVNGSIEASFELLKPWIRNVHINELTSGYPYRDLFRLLKAAKYDRYTLCEAQESKEPERFLRWYRALWLELQRG